MPFQRLNVKNQYCAHRRCRGDLLFKVFSASRDIGTILFASWITCPRNSPTDSHDAASSLPVLPTVEAALCLTNDRTVESWNAHFAARTSPMCGITSWASCKYDESAYETRHVNGEHSQIYRN